MLEVLINNSGVTEKFISNSKIQKKCAVIRDNLHGFDKSCGTGWVELPSQTTKQEILNLKEMAKEINEMAEMLIVIGIGGSVNGAKMGIDLFKKQNAKTEVVFLGENYSAKHIQKVLEEAKNKSVCVNVISKSGNTLETLIAFQLVEDFMKKKYKKGEYKNRIFVTTDHELGNLRAIATAEGYRSLIIPRTIGGRYSFFTAVGLLPMAVAGVNIEKLIVGALRAEKVCADTNLSMNPAYRYAITRHFLETKKKKMVEVIASFDERLVLFFEWYKQLFMESEGKNKKGLFVSSLNYPKDLHSAEQFVLDGNPILFETLININKQNSDLTLDKIKENRPLFNFNGKSLSEIQTEQLQRVQALHKEVGIPQIVIEMDELTEENMGELIYFLFYVCAVNCLLCGADPFSQPAVEKNKL